MLHSNLFLLIRILVKQHMMLLSYKEPLLFKEHEVQGLNILLSSL